LINHTNKLFLEKEIKRRKIIRLKNGNTFFKKKIPHHLHQIVGQHDTLKLTFIDLNKMKKKKKKKGKEKEKNEIYLMLHRNITNW